MPTYEYRCRSCGEHLEVVQAFSDEPLTTHDACGGELRKVFGNVGITFKGSGFYRTDSRYGSSSTRSGAKGDGESSSSSESSSSESSSGSSSGGDGGSSPKSDSGASKGSSSSDAA